MVILCFEITNKGIIYRDYAAKLYIDTTKFFKFALGLSTTL